ncbi:MAG: vWA domain-containing protein [Planctomycetota bacterium]
MKLSYCCLVVLVTGLSSVMCGCRSLDDESKFMAKNKHGAEAAQEVCLQEADPGIIKFYNSVYEADTFFWLIDTSERMDTGTPTRLDTLKAELIAAIRSLSHRAKFGIVGFSTSPKKFHPTAVLATSSEKQRAIAWVRSLDASGSSCFSDGLNACLEIANSCRRRYKRIVCLADGAPNCPGRTTETTTVAEANWQRIPIDTILCGDDTEGAEWMRDLAIMNGGSFAQIAPGAE